MTNEPEQPSFLFLRIELEKLRDEIYELKRCQIDFIKLSTIIFGLVASVIAALTPHLHIIGKNLKPINVLLYLSILSVIGLVYPYIVWVIIHKCRSIFRIVAYIRFMEEITTRKGVEIEKTYYGYERLHRKLKEHRWLKIRIFSFDNLFKRVFRDVRSYKHWINMTKDEDRKTSNSDLHSTNGLEKKGPYIGDYYGKLLFFIKLLWSIGSMGLILLSAYGVYKSEGFWQFLFGFIGSFFVLWSIYHLRLAKRYLLELRYRPFSIDAHYDMWKWALDNVQNTNV